MPDDNVTLTRADFDALMQLTERSRQFVYYLDWLLTVARPFNRFDLTHDAVNAFVATVRGLPKIEPIVQPIVAFPEDAKHGGKIEVGFAGQNYIGDELKGNVIPYNTRTRTTPKRRARKSRG